MTTIVKTDLPNLTYRGKVRDTYDLGEYLLMVATDRISAFDAVLPTGIPGKGVILSSLSVFWFEKTAHLVPNHYVAMATDASDLTVNLPELDSELAKRAMVVRKAERIDVECIVRGYITGSAWAEYKKQGSVGGSPMPSGLQESQEFPEPLFTPSTKAETGHDENITIDEMKEMVGADLTEELREKSLQVYSLAREFAVTKGIIIADTKMEFGLIDGQVSLIDELLTPDSSRFWDADRYSPGSSQPNFDKQFVRDWLTESGWDREPPAPPLPADVVGRTADRYSEAYRRLTGESI